MKINKNLINKYNNNQNMVVISSYPLKGEIYSGKVGGIASFAKNTVRHFPRNAVVLAEYFDKPEIYEEGNSLVIRCFRKNSPFMWFDIINMLARFDNIKDVLFQFDFALYGDVFVSSLAVAFLTFLKLKGYRTNIVVHSVIRDVFTLSGHLGLDGKIWDRVKGRALNLFFHTFYFLLGFLTSKVIVNDEVLKQELVRYIPSGKLVSIPHGVDTDLAKTNKAHARKLLSIGEKEEVVLFFGFINWFKGADLFVSSFKNIRKILGNKARFVIAGGESATLSQKNYYRKYFAEIKREIGNSKNVEMTGFVPQKKIGLYFSACDLVVFPYRSFISASGVLSLVFSYQKPFIISSHIEGMLESRDVKKSFQEAGLSREELVFEMTNGEIVSLTKKVLRNGIKRKMCNLSAKVRSDRSWDRTALLYERVVFAKERVFDKVLLKPEIVLSYAKKSI